MDATRSALYECTVTHERLEPVRHRFAYRLFYLLVDLDELPVLNRRLSLFSVNRANVLSLREGDFLPTGGPAHNAAPGRPAPAGADSLKERALAFLEAHGVATGRNPRVLLVTLPRVLGYQFNPVSFYFCLGEGGEPLGAIAEVTNTFREVKPYFIPPVGVPDGAEFSLRVPKNFYVSPFSGLDVAFDFTLRVPGRTLGVRIDDYRDGRRVLHSALAGTRCPLSDGRLLGFLVKYPLVTVKVIVLIHWQALLLRLKRAPFFRKADGADRQRDLYRPHRSLTPRPLP